MGPAVPAMNRVRDNGHNIDRRCACHWPAAESAPTRHRFFCVRPCKPQGLIAEREQLPAPINYGWEFQQNGPSSERLTISEVEGRPSRPALVSPRCKGPGLQESETCLCAPGSKYYFEFTAATTMLSITSFTRFPGKLWLLLRTENASRSPFAVTA